MPSTTISIAPNLTSFLKSLKESPTNVESSIQNLVNLLKRRQIRGPRQCAIATAYLLKLVIRKYKAKDTKALIQRVQDVGARITEAQPKELAINNIVRRVLGVIREEADGDREVDPVSSFPNSEPGTPRKRGVSPPQSSSILPTMADLEITHRPPLLTSHTSYAATTNAPMVNSLFNLLSQPLSSAPTSGSQSPAQPAFSNLGSSSVRPKDLSAEVVDGVEEIIDELENMDDQIAAYATDHIHANEIILTHGSSLTVQRFLLRAASKRKFTVIHAEGYPNQHHQSHAAITGKHRAGNNPDNDSDASYFAKPLIAAGITVILIPDSAVFALMSRVNKVILGTHAILANGGLIAAAGSKSIALAAREHRTPVVVVTGVYKLCPSFIFDSDPFIEYGEPGAVLGYDADNELVEALDVENPLQDYVEGELVDLFITNLGGHAPFGLSGVIAEQYRSEDTDPAGE